MSSRERRRKQLRAKIECKRADRTNNHQARDRIVDEAAAAMGPGSLELMSTLRTLCDVSSGSGSPQEKQRRVEDVVRGMPQHMQRQIHELSGVGKGGIQDMFASLLAGASTDDTVRDTTVGASTDDTVRDTTVGASTKTDEDRRKVRNRKRNAKRKLRKKRLNCDDDEPPLPDGGGLVVQTGDAIQGLVTMQTMLGGLTM